MSLKKQRENNPLFGKFNKESSVELMRQKALNRKHSEDIKLKMSAIRRNSVNIYEKLYSEGFKLIDCVLQLEELLKF
jgi:NUMOD3 motif